MVATCSVVNCTNRHSAGCGISFLRFPADASQLLLRHLEPKASKLTAWRGEETKDPGPVKPGPRPWRELSIADQLFAVLVRLRHGSSGADIAARMRLPESSFSRLFSTWVLFLSSELSSLFPWPSRTLVQRHMPQVFRDKFPNIRIVIDCMEIQMERPASLQNQCVTFSNYKSRNTMKILIGISPAGVVTFDPRSGVAGYRTKLSLKRAVC